MNVLMMCFTNAFKKCNDCQFYNKDFKIKFVATKCELRENKIK